MPNNIAQTRKRPIIQQYNQGYQHFRNAIKVWSKARQNAVTAEQRDALLEHQTQLKKAVTDADEALYHTLLIYLNSGIVPEVERPQLKGRPPFPVLLEFMQKYAEPPLSDDSAEKLKILRKFRNEIIHPERFPGIVPGINQLENWFEEIARIITTYLQVNETELTPVSSKPKVKVSPVIPDPTPVPSVEETDSTQPETEAAQVFKSEIIVKFRLVLPLRLATDPTADIPLSPKFTNAPISLELSRHGETYVMCNRGETATVELNYKGMSEESAYRPCATNETKALRVDSIIRVGKVRLQVLNEHELQFAVRVEQLAEFSVGNWQADLPLLGLGRIEVLFKHYDTKNNTKSFVVEAAAPGRTLLARRQANLDWYQSNRFLLADGSEVRLENGLVLQLKVTL